MLRKTFGTFVEKKKRDGVRQLKLIEEMLRQHRLRVEAHLQAEDGGDPYIFCYNPSKDSSFDGVRIYKLGDQIAFRVQKENSTHPYGRAYPLDLEAMFNDYLEDEDTDEEKAGRKVMESVVKELHRFFALSGEVEKKERRQAFGDPAAGDEPGGQMGNIAIRQSGSDYSSLIYSKS